MTKEEFGGMITQYEKLVYTICYQFTHNHHTAQDLAQETFISAYTHLDSCPLDNPKAWVARIATNKAKDHLKSAYNRRVQSASDETLPNEGALFLRAEQPEELVSGAEEYAAIKQEISALKEPYNQVASLYFLGECSVAEISDRLGRPKKTVQTQIFRAKNQLRQRLAQQQLVPAGA